VAIKASASARVAAANSGAIYAQMLAGATKPITIRAVTVVSRTGVATEVGLARSFSVGTASAGNVATGICHRATEGVVGTVELGWGTNPTGPTGVHPYLRRETIGAATGTRVELWKFDDGPLVVEPTGMTGMGMLLVNVGSAPGAALDVHVTWEYGPATDT